MSRSIQVLALSRYHDFAVKFVLDKQVVFELYILGDSSKEADEEAAELAAQITFKVSQERKKLGL